MSKHTKGPWKPARDSNYVDGDTNADDATTICEVFAYPEQAANAALIAAAPDLLACLLPNSVDSIAKILRGHGYEYEAGQIEAAIDRVEPKP